MQTVPDAATFTRLQTEWAGGSVTAAGSTTRGAGGRRLQQAPPDAAGQPTVLPSSAVGTWSNCSASCRYEGLGSGLYSLRVRAVDAAGNAGNETQPYPLEVRGRGGAGAGAARATHPLAHSQAIGAAAGSGCGSSGLPLTAAAG